MTRNLDKRVEIAWPVLDPDLKKKVLDYFNTMLSDTAKLRELKSDGTYTDLCAFVPTDENGKRAKPFDAHDSLIKDAYIAAERAASTKSAPITATMSDLAEEAIEDIVVIDDEGNQHSVDEIKAEETQAEDKPKEKRGFWARLFGR